MSKPAESKVVPSAEWLQILDNLEGCRNFPAYLRELARTFEDDRRRNVDGVVRLEVLEPEQADLQLKGFLEYFEECPEDWEYVDAGELEAAFRRLPIFGSSSEHCVELDADFSPERRQALVRVSMRAEAKKKTIERNAAQLKVDMYLADAQHQRARTTERARLANAVRRGDLRAALKLAE